jgi:hypothetical protein
MQPFVQLKTNSASGPGACKVLGEVDLIAPDACVVAAMDSLMTEQIVVRYSDGNPD